MLALVLSMCSCASRSSGRLEAVGSLDTIRAQHAEVDRLIDSGELEKARSVLEAALGRPKQRVIRQDLYYRLAEVNLELSLPDRALAAADAGLALGRGADIFTANLLVSEGRALESLHRDREAAATYADALAIDEALLEKALEHE
jgi:predicted negative regulator of RcsB-dependent stress response